MNKLKEFWKALWTDPEYVLTMLIFIWIFSYIILKLLPGWGFWTFLITLPYAAVTGYLAARFPHELRMEVLHKEFDEKIEEVNKDFERMIREREARFKDLFEENADEKTFTGWTD